MARLRIETLQEQLPERYRVKKKLGDGAAGSVFLVEDLERDGLHLALKVLTNTQAFDEHTLERFCEEIDISRKLRHKNLVRALELVHIGSTIAFTMEYIEGEDLSRQLESGKKYSTEDVLLILRQLLEGVSALHEKDIVHRDLKLENVLVRKDGVVKLSDLGLVKRLDAQGLTKTGLLLGTAQYMPPEYVKEGLYDVRSDLYAIGVLAVELFSGKRRLAGKKGNVALEELMRAKFRIPDAVMSEVPKKIRPVIERAIAIRPKDRFESAEEFSRALDHAYRGVAPLTEKSSSRVKMSSFLESQDKVNARLRVYKFLILICALLVASIIMVLLMR